MLFIVRELEYSSFVEVHEANSLSVDWQNYFDQILGEALHEADIDRN